MPFDGPIAGRTWNDLQQQEKGREDHIVEMLVEQGISNDSALAVLRELQRDLPKADVETMKHMLGCLTLVMINVVESIDLPVGRDDNEAADCIGCGRLIEEEGCPACGWKPVA